MEKIVHWASQEIFQISQELGIEFQEVERQVRLHLPSHIEFDKKGIFVGSISPFFWQLIRDRFKGYGDNFKTYIELSGGNFLKSDYFVVKNDGFCVSGLRNLPYRFDAVNFEHSKFIESNLHYLRSFRDNEMYRFGLFLNDFKYPFCYMSFCIDDRGYRKFALEQFINNKPILRPILQLSRVFGFGKLPRNSISKLITLSLERLKYVNADFVITAINPCLGFTGSSMTASGFLPFAYSPVSYNYDENGFYINRRSPGESFPSRINMPPNLLFVKGINSTSKKMISPSSSMFTISNDLFEDQPLELQFFLSSLREILERNWSQLTAYHKTPRSIIDPISKGQCGVTTALLAKEILSQGFKVLFCRGSAFFPSGFPPIRDHCWLKIPSIELSGKLYANLIVDLTADQNGFTEPVICASSRQLYQKSIFYKADSETNPEDITNSDLLKRLRLLQESLGEQIDGVASGQTV